MRLFSRLYRLQIALLLGLSTCVMPSLAFATETWPAIPADGPILQLRGSSTLGRDLAPRMVSALLKSKGFSAVKTEPLGDNEYRVSALSPQGQPAWALISGQGSSTGFSSMLQNKADVAMSSRPISSLEATSLLPQGNLLAPEAEHVVALDGVAVLVNPGNPLSELKTSQIAAIFSGKISNWQQLGGPAGEIHLYVRDGQSGTRTSFEDMVLKPHGMTLATNSISVRDGSELAQHVARDPLAIGFSSLSDTGGTRAVAVSLPGTRSISPSSDSVACEDYPLSRRLYFYVSPQHDNAWAHELTRFATSPAGQQVVTETELVAQKVSPIEVLAEHAMPPTYLRLVESARRLTTTLRFRSGSELDSKSIHDLQRLVTFLRNSKQPVRGITLVGFNERSESPGRAMALARLRAASIQRALTSEGIYVNEVLALGHFLPVADNDSADGQMKNRRVEVWIN